ncbi:hypothetical protein JXA34_00420 [Patescibacteria group bacterium]|nr:hypothetical protein [Patescibacteria group bacterium]
MLGHLDGETDEENRLFFVDIYPLIEVEGDTSSEFDILKSALKHFGETANCAFSQDLYNRLEKYGS